MMFKLLGAFLLLWSLATLAQRPGTTEGGIDQGKGPTANSGNSKKIPIVYKSKGRPLLCLGTTWDISKPAVEMFWCENGTMPNMSFTQFRYGDDGVFLLKQNNDLGRCHEVEDSPLDICVRSISISQKCDERKQGQRFWFEPYEDEGRGYGIIRSEKNISERCSAEGPPALHLMFRDDLAGVHLAPATEQAKNDVLWKIKKWDCRKEP